jgi:hypothetical protein
MTLGQVFSRRALIGGRIRVSEQASPELELRACHNNGGEHHKLTVTLEMDSEP